MVLRIVVRKLKFLRFLAEIISFRNTGLITTYYFKKFIFRKKIPEVVYLDVVFRCQFRCEYCGIASYSSDGEEISFEEVKRIIDQLVILGIPRVHFSGGEPLLRNDLEEMIFYSYKKGLLTVLETNGWSLSFERVVKLKKNHLSCICISLNGADKETHDNISRMKGSFSRVIKSIKFCKRERLPCVLSIIVRRKLLLSGGLLGILKLAEDLDVLGIRLISPRPMGRWLNREDEVLNEEEKNKAKRIVNLTTVPLLGIGPNERFCGAVTHSIFISSTTEVQPCGYIPYSFGNIRHMNLTLILKYLLNHSMYEMLKKCRGCAIQDREFRATYINSIKQESDLPIRLY